MENNCNCLGSYKDFLVPFIESGYRFIKFPELTGADKEIVLRHDIDFDTRLALRCAEEEVALGVRSTYFFLLRSEFYNPFSANTFKDICAIRDMGHDVSIHFDPTLYEDFHQGFRDEKRYFEMVFDVPVKTISLHRPNEFFQQFNEPIGAVEHTYQSKYFKDVKYFADSTGVWRFGHPHASSEFAAGKALHVLTHPIWWFIEGATNLEVLHAFYKARINAFKTDFGANSIPFRSIIDHV